MCIDLPSKTSLLKFSKLKQQKQSTSSTSYLMTYKETIALEKRIVFDGAGAATAAGSDVAMDSDNSQDDSNAQDNNANVAELAGLEMSDHDTPIEIAFIDMRLHDAQGLADSMRDNVIVVFLDPTRDGVSQIGEVLSSFEQVETVHLFTHADNTGLRLGSTLVTSDTIDEHAEAFSSWQNYLSESADIMFYGCDLAENADGQSLLAEIAELTSADIAASTDLTGAENLGGDWDMEFTIGAINSALSVTAEGQANYEGILVAQPEATITGPAEDPLIGEQTTITVTFDNSSGVSTDTGFGPYVNLFLPFLGQDGAYNPTTDTYTSSEDGVSFVSATYFGTSVDSTTITLEDIDSATAGIQFEHSVAVDNTGNPLVVTLDDGLGLQEGDQLIILQLPFGSYTADQPAANIEVTLDVSGDADVGSGLDIITNAGFEFGSTAENDFTTDPSLQAATLTTGNTNNATITPQLFRVTSTLNTAESEVATGPNSERSYDIEIEVASGQTIDDASLDFTFAEELVYTSGNATGGGVLDISNLGQTAGGDLSDDVLTVDFTTLSGTQTITANFYVSEFDQSGANVINPTAGTTNTVGEFNNITFSGDWTAADTRDGSTAVSDTSTAEILDAESLSVQKSVAIIAETGAAGATPDDTLEYTVNFQVSDFFAFDTLTLSDTFSDGQNFDATFTPTLNITSQGSVLAGQNFTINTDFTLVENTGTDYSETLTFDVSALLTTAFGSSVLEGGKFGPDDLGATTGTIVFRTVIQDTYADPALGADDFVKQGDTFTNTASISGRNLQTDLNPFPGPQTVFDFTGTNITVPSNNVSLSIYALNGSTSGTLTDIRPGDDVTFRLEYDLVTGDFEDFFLDAYLPLPIFTISDIDANGVGGDNFILDNGSVIPTVGDFRYGPTATADITTGIPTPTASVDGDANSVRFDLGDLSDPANDGGTIDILFTIRATNLPFADGLQLTTLAQQQDENTPFTPAITNDLEQLVAQQPEINNITKGVVSTDNGNGIFSDGTPSGIKAAGNGDANPLNTTVTSANIGSLNLDNNLTGADDGDLVRYAIVIENTGSSPNGAFDLTISDIIPAGLEVPAGGLNLQVVDGTGAAIGIDTPSPETALFAGGITLTDNGATGVLGSANGVAGENIIIITYDLEVSDATEAGTVLTSSATLSNFASTEGGPDFTAVDLTDAATVTTLSTDVDKQITNTNQAHTAGNDVVVGEVVEYTVVLTIPEGLSSSAVLEDRLDAGLAFVGITGLTIDSADLTSSNGTDATILANNITFSNIGGGINNEGRLLTIDLGDLTNVNTDNSTAETITITYDVIVANTPAVNDGALLNNAANFTSTNDDVTDNAPNLNVVEPQLNVTIVPNNANPDAGDTTTWTVTITAPAGNDADAFDATYANLIPAGLTYVNGSANHVGGIAPDTALTENGGNFTANFAQFQPGQTSTFTFQTTIDGTAAVGQTLDVSGTTTWQSISGALADTSPHTTVDIERTGTGTPALNDYTDTGTGGVTIPIPAPILTLDATSETNNGNDVTAGEIVRYRFTVQVPESTTTDFRVETNLPASLQYLNDGTTTIGFVSDGTLSSDSATLIGGTLDITGDETTLGTDEPTFTLNGANISTAGNNAEFLLGEIANLDDDANQEFIVIEFNALVLNDANVNDGDTLTTDTDVKTGTTVLASTNDVDVNVVEPDIVDLAKQVIDTNGTTATYQISFSNTSGTDAFDVNLTDSIPANLTNLSNISITPAGGAILSTNSSAGTNIDLDFTTIPDGGSVTITYTADIVDPDVIVADTDATVTWTSIPGTTSTLGTSASGLAGSATGERTGNGVGVNDYTISEGAGLSVISGTLWNDLDGDDIVDGGEPLQANVQVNLTHAGVDGTFGNADDIILTTLTDANGEYSFGVLPSGDVRLSVQPSDMPNGISNLLVPSFDPTGSTTDSLIELTLSEGTTNANNNFGFVENQPPAGMDNVFNVAEDTIITFSTSDFGFSDPNLDPFDNVRIDTLPTDGILQLNGTAVTPEQVIAVSDISSLTFTPEANEFGAPYTDFTFSVQDDIGLFDPTPNTITINLSPAPDNPEGTDNSFEISSSETITLADTVFGFFDIDGDNFDNVRIDTLPPANEGTILLNGLPITAGQIINNTDFPNLVFEPVTGFAGITDFTFSVQDDTGLFDLVPNTITVNIGDVEFNIPTVETIPPVETPFNPPPASIPPITPSELIAEVINPDGIRVFNFGQRDFLDIENENPSLPDFWLAGAVSQKLLIENKEGTFQVSKGIFKHSNPGEVLSYKAELSDGSPLPDWLVFDGGDLTFRGTPPLDAPEALELVIIASDTKDNKVKAPVRVIINREIDDNQTTPPQEQKTAPINEIAPENSKQIEENGDETPKEEKEGFLSPEFLEKFNGRPSFHEQLEDQSRHASITQHQNFLDSLSG